ncbi:FecCD family ABC transporter permease [Salibacterium lacus]|uniref:FecCD family ABC transporter permease n=1 Tax=Salibacterium lacus TaxID=1898109 RepID=A0ABW5T4Z5_9BACI
MEKKRRIVPLLIIGLSPVLFMGTILLSISYGAKDIEPAVIQEAFFHYDSSNVDHAVIMTARLPRALGAVMVGAFLAVSGALMQGMTRNYLASPSIMGVTDGSAFVVTLCMVFAPGMASSTMILYSMLGSALGAAIVFGFGSLLRNGLSPVRLAIIGTVIGTFLSSLSSAVASYFEVSQTISFWYNARLHQLSMDLLLLGLPAGIIGLLLAIAAARSITILALGDEMSTNLGQRPVLLKTVTMISVIFLTGTAVALVGKIGFVGLLIPHITRFIVGVDYKWVIPCTGIIGGFFLGMSDLLSRLINYPFETPIGVVTSVLGVPFFLYLIRTRGGKSHV